jgi:hypothetical protein
MKLGDFIHQKLSEQALPAPTQVAISVTLPKILSLYLAGDATKELVQSIEDYLRTEDFASAVSDAVGESKPDETEDQFVSRAKSAIEGILTQRFDRRTR